MGREAELEQSALLKNTQNIDYYNEGEPTLEQGDDTNNIQSEYSDINLNGPQQVDSSNTSTIFGEIESANEIDENNGRPPRQMWGIVLVLLSVCSYTCYTLIAKNLIAYRHVPYIQVVITRSMLTWIIDLLLIQWYHKQGETFSYFGELNQRKWLIIRALGCFGTNFLWMWSLLWLTPGDSDTIWQVSAFWVLISAHFFLGEKMDLMAWFCVCFGLIGVVLIAQPSFIFHSHNEYTSELNKWIGIILVISSTLAYTVQTLILRAKSVSIHWLQFEFITATLATWVLIPTVGLCYFLAHYLMWNDASRAILSIYNPWITYTDWLQVISLGVVGCFATATLTRATQLAQARWVSIIMYSEVPLAYIGQVIIYHLYADTLTWIGAAIVLTAVLVPSLREICLESMNPQLNSITGNDKQVSNIEDDKQHQEQLIGIKSPNSIINEENTPLLSKSQNVTTV